MKVALIGSFRQHYDAVRAAAASLEAAGHEIASPACTEVIGGDEFVRFESDDAALSDPAVQSVTLHNIFNADVVYVVNPGGYVGRTTCYEVGRIVQRRQPIYFLSAPADLPIDLPQWAVLPAEEFAKLLSESKSIRWLYDNDDPRFEIERGLR